MDIDIDTSSLDRLAKNADKIEGENEVSFEDLFTLEFMRTYTSYPSFEEFLLDSALIEEPITQDSFEAISEDPWDEWVANNSSFQDWEDMLSTAGVEYVKRNLFEGV